MSCRFESYRLYQFFYGIVIAPFPKRIVDNWINNVGSNPISPTIYKNFLYFFLAFLVFKNYL
jgi:hypothetical protein